MHKGYQIKIGDLGVAKLLKRSKFAFTQVGTPYYTSPEVWQNKPYGAKSDIWSLGCLLYELTTLRRPFEADDLDTLVKRICRGKYPPIPSMYSSDLSLLIKKMLSMQPSNHIYLINLALDPAKRPTINEILDMECVKSRLYLIKKIYENEEDFTTGDTFFEYKSPQIKLRETIKVPKNLNEITFPSPMYNRNANSEKENRKSITKLPRLNLRNVGRGINYFTKNIK